MGKRTNTAAWSEKHKRWQINVQRDGKRRSFYSSTPGRTGQREANAKADAWLDDGIEAGSARVSALYAEYIASQKESTGKGHWHGVESRYKNHIAPIIGHKRIDRVTEQDLQDIINKAYAQHGLAAKTLLNLRGDLSSFLKFCRRRKVSTLFPDGLTIPASAKRPDKGILQPNDLIKLFNSDRTLYRGKPAVEKYINAFRFEVLTGMRPGEIIGLCWEDIHGQSVHLKRSVNRYGETTQGKNRNAVRTVELPEMAAAVLDAQRALTGGKGSVFDISTQENYRQHWERYRTLNGMSKTTPYELRHTFVSVAKILPEGQVKAVVGHSRNMDTFGVYGHALTGEAEETAREIDGVFAKLLQKD